jgi:6-phosphofructokinase
MARKALSFEARALIREVVDADAGIPIEQSDAREELYQLGYITRGSSTAGPNRFEATAAGIDAAARIVADSGDGPEALKAMFGPLVRPSR